LPECYRARVLSAPQLDNLAVGTEAHNIVVDVYAGVLVVLIARYRASNFYEVAGLNGVLLCNNLLFIVHDKRIKRARKMYNPMAGPPFTVAWLIVLFVGDGAIAVRNFPAKSGHLISYARESLVSLGPDRSAPRCLRPVALSVFRDSDGKVKARARVSVFIGKRAAFVVGCIRLIK
jgi:hypothetical protein